MPDRIRRPYRWLDPEPRFWPKVDRSGGPDACWIWKASLNDNGYGMFTYQGRKRGAHIFAYEYFVGPVPEGEEIDHICEVRPCVNPRHLQTLTHRANALKSSSLAALNARKTHCQNGHEFTPDNIKLEDGRRRRCRTCSRDYAREYARRRRAQARRDAA